MKIKIIKKTITEGDNAKGHYCIKSLFCSVDSKEDANALAMDAVAAGATKDQIIALIKAGEYEGNVSYTFGLNCSNFTFDRVERFGTLDADVEFIKSEKNGNVYFNAKIKVLDKKEQVYGYESPAPREEEVTGWASPAPEIKTQQPYGDGSHAEPLPITPFGIDPNTLDPAGCNDLPF